ncbi:hypothetical protein F5X68DRAFT_36574 [Plectosphaerella plurivora]|uniref:Uncharacterized protein n=1 Tax=Plectosphaerella plurivora TaxID=936078 RepID=A0A9P8V6U3_9PEZI|nr:hypothetical protein F5X68DRAFT_36574 [Plectosphaerella plurivora]
MTPTLLGAGHIQLSAHSSLRSAPLDTTTDSRKRDGLVQATSSQSTHVLTSAAVASESDGTRDAWSLVPGISQSLKAISDQYHATVPVIAATAHTTCTSRFPSPQSMEGRSTTARRAHMFGFIPDGDRAWWQSGANPVPAPLARAYMKEVRFWVGFCPRWSACIRTPPQPPRAHRSTGYSPSRRDVLGLALENATAKKVMLGSPETSCHDGCSRRRSQPRQPQTVVLFGV